MELFSIRIQRTFQLVSTGGDKQAAERSSSEETTGRPGAVQGLGKPDVPAARDAFC